MTPATKDPADPENEIVIRLDGRSLEVDGLSLEEFIAMVVERKGGRERASDSPWLTTEEAAEYLRCPVSRIRKLSATRDLPLEKDGRRNLYHRDKLDEYVHRGGAVST